MSAIEETSFGEAVVAAGLLLPTAVRGLYGRGASFERVVEALDTLIVAETAADGAEVVRFPPVLPRHDLESSGYLASFPHLAGSVFSFTGDDREAIELGLRARNHDDWSELQTRTDVCLTPAACYPVYPWVAASGRLAEEGRLIDVSSYCFRHEPSSDPGRMQAFRMHEHVRLGLPDDVSNWHQGWVERGRLIIQSMDLSVEAVPASDPFFGRTGRMLSFNQVAQGLKLELVCAVADTQPTPVMSINYHQDHFSRDFGIEGPEGATVHSACIGFGLERLALALFRAHGVNADGWPREVAQRLRLR